MRYNNYMQNTYDIYNIKSKIWKEPHLIDDIDKLLELQNAILKYRMEYDVLGVIDVAADMGVLQTLRHLLSNGHELKQETMKLITDTIQQQEGRYIEMELLRS